MTLITPIILIYFLHLAAKYRQGYTGYSFIIDGYKTMMLTMALLSIGFYLVASVLVLQQFFGSQPYVPNRVLPVAWLAIVLHLTTLGMAIIQTQPTQNLSVLNVASLVALLINIGLTSISKRQNSWILLPFAYAFAVVLLFSNSFTPSHYLTSLSDRPGLVAHIALALLSYAMMSIASLFALLQVYLNYQLKQRRKLNLQNVPPLLTIEKQLVRLLQIGGVLLTLSISSGFAFLDNMLAPSNLDKAGLSIIAWCIYATLLWGHYRRGWRGQRLVVMTLTGNVLLAVAYFGSRLLQTML